MFAGEPISEGKDVVIKRINFYKDEVERMAKAEKLSPLEELLALPMAKERLRMWESILASYN